MKHRKCPKHNLPIIHVGGCSKCIEEVGMDTYDIPTLVKRCEVEIEKIRKLLNAHRELREEGKKRIDKILSTINR